MPEDWSVFGWQGIKFTMPADWNLGLVEEERGRNFLRIDDARMTRMEVEWNSVRKPVATGRLVDRYVRKLEKQSKRSRLDFQAKRGLKLGPLKKRDGEFFYWRADCQSWNLVSFCHACRRLLFVKIFGKLDEDMEKQVTRIYKSMSDHSTGKHSLWALYGLSCEVPVDFSLTSHSLKAGRVALGFQRGREELDLECVSLANVLLADTDLKSWYPGFHRGQLAGFRYEPGPWSVSGHEGLQIKGHRKFWPPRRTPCRDLNIDLWQCPESNKIFVVRGVTGKGDTSLADTVSARVFCHAKKKSDHQRRHA